MKITDSRANDILRWLDDETGNHALLFEKMTLHRDAAALIRQLQAELQDAWHAGMDEGREQGRGKDHAHQPPSVPVGVEAAIRAFWRGYNAASTGAGGRQQGRVAAGVVAVLALAQQPAAVYAAYPTRSGQPAHGGCERCSRCREGDFARCKNRQYAYLAAQPGGSDNDR